MARSYVDEADGTPRTTKGQDGASFVLPIGDGALASDGKVINLAGAMTINRNGDGTVNYLQVAEDGVTYRQTFSYLDGELVGLTAWTAQ